MENKQADIIARLAVHGGDHLHLSRLIAGVVYALEEYNRLAILAPKEPQTDQYYLDELQHLLSVFQSAAGPPNNWLRVFFYNDGILRLDAAWEWTLRIIKKDVKTSARVLYNKIFVYETYTGSIFQQVRTEVNVLKHDFRGLLEEIRENPAILSEGLVQLLSLVKQRLI